MIDVEVLDVKDIIRIVWAISVFKARRVERWFIIVENTKQILNECTNFIRLSFFLQIHSLQVSDHIHNFDQSFVKDVLLSLQVSNKFLHIIDRTFGFDTIDSVLKDSLGLILAEEDLTRDQRWLIANCARNKGDCRCNKKGNENKAEH